MRVRSLIRSLQIKIGLFFLIVLGQIFTSCHVGRFFIYNFADVRDYKKFPVKSVTRSEQPFYFYEAAGLNKIKLPEKLRRNGKDVIFEKALKKSGTYALVIIRNDSVLYEWYDRGF